MADAHSWGPCLSYSYYDKEVITPVGWGGGGLSRAVLFYPTSRSLGCHACFMRESGVVVGALR